MLWLQHKLVFPLFPNMQIYLKKLPMHAAYKNINISTINFIQDFLQIKQKMSRRKRSSVCFIYLRSTHIRLLQTYHQSLSHGKQ